MSKTYSIVNNDFVLKNEASILISDLSIQRGYGVFDYFRTINNQPIFLEDHLERLFHSASGLNLNVALSRDQLKTLIQSLIEKNNIPDSGIRITLTGGCSEDGYSLAKPNLLITQTAFSFNAENFNKGIKLLTYEHQRQLPWIKTIDYLMAIRLQRYIKENNADDVLYHNQNKITECPRCNFFIVTQNDEVVTPATNILEGITRKKILGFSEFNVKEAFISSTTKNVLPVLEIDGRVVGDGKPGKITTNIYEKVCVLKGEANVPIKP